MIALFHESHEQPGLEVVLSPEDKQVISPSWKGGVAAKYTNYDSYPNEDSYPQQYSAEQTSGRRWYKRKPWLILGVLILIMVIAGGVVGGVVGSQATQSSGSNSSGGASSNGTDSGNGTSSDNSTVSLTSIAQGSPLAVTGYRSSNGVLIYLYYQAADGSMHHSEYDSGRGSFTVNNSYWENSTVTDSTIASSSSIGAAMLLWSTAYNPQIEVFYRSASNLLSGVYWNQGSTPVSDLDSIVNLDLETSTNRSVASYWPYVVYQDAQGILWEVMDSPILDHALSPGGWENTSLNVSAIDGSGLAVVPLSTNFADIASAGGYGVFYQSDEKLVALVPRLEESTINSSWPTTFPSISFPQGNGLAAFSTARPEDEGGRVNTYLLYQVEGGQIHMVWTDDGEAWQTSQPAALTDADDGTDIACLTMPTSYYDADEQQLSLEAASSETRCYFQRGTYVREVVLSGTEWAEIGTVPMS